ncbi:MAG: hypothetical protein IPK03_09840, partial [Bacteroidetes bacterium]|nr:hypothetical protein [Bacteroidota bacterium]
MYTFGYNSEGELGNGSLTQSITPTRPLRGLYNGTTYLGDNVNTPIIAISASKYNSMALASDGIVYTFGRNAEGQLGDNTLALKTTPVKVLKGNYIGTTFLGDYYANPIVSIASSDYRAAAIAADGTIYSFGYNGNGQLGDNTTITRLIPVRVLKGLYAGNTYLGDSSTNPIVAISMGTLHSSALAADGKMFTWGANFFGQLGDGTVTQRLTPVRAFKGAYFGTSFLGDDISNPIVSIAGAGNHSTAITKDGFVFSFGYNNAGQLGDSTLTNRLSPVQVRGVNPTGNLNVLFNSLEATITALPANRITYTSAYLNGLVNPNNLITTTEFEYGLTASYGEIAPIGGTLSGILPQRISAPLCNLIPGKTYHFRVKASN